MPRQGTAALTNKQEAFALAVIKLDNASAAYRSAYETNGMTSKTVNEEACRLLAHPKVSARIEQLRAPALKKAAMDAEQTILEIAGVAKMTPEDPPKYSDKLAALQMMAKHHGIFEKDNSQLRESLSIKIELVE